MEVKNISNQHEYKLVLRDNFTEYFNWCEKKKRKTYFTSTKFHWPLVLVFLIDQHFPKYSKTFKINFFIYIFFLLHMMKTVLATHPLTIYPLLSWQTWNPKTRTSLHEPEQNNYIYISSASTWIYEDKNNISFSFHLLSFLSLLSFYSLRACLTNWAEISL